MQQRLLQRQAPISRAQYEALVSQRSELQQQMQQLNERRNLLYAQSRREGADRASIEARMGDIDARSARLDRQIESLNDQISDAIARGAPDQRTPQPTREVRVPQITIPPIDVSRRQRRDDMRDVAGFMAAEAVVLALIGVAFWRLGMKRMRQQFDRLFASQTRQLDQLQQAVEVIGVEVERIAEGQRYVAKVLSEGSPQAGALPVRRKESPG